MLKINELKSGESSHSKEKSHLSSPHPGHNRLFEVQVIVVNVKRKYEIRRLFGDEARVLSIKPTWWPKEIFYSETDAPNNSSLSLPSHAL